MADIKALLDDASRRGDVAFVEHEGSRSVVWLLGEHDLATAAALSSIVAQSVALDDADVVLDLSAVAFMDASTVGVIVSAGELLDRAARLLQLRSPSACARRLINFCGLSDRLEPDLGRVARGCDGTTRGAIGGVPPRRSRQRSTRDEASSRSRERDARVASRADWSAFGIFKGPLHAGRKGGAGQTAFDDRVTE